MQFGEPFGGLLPGARGVVLAALLRTGAPLTGRQVHTLVGNRASLWSVQQALAHLADLGIVETETAGQAKLHTINELHYAIEPLRALLDPFAALQATVRDQADDEVEAVIVFGSVARGEATPTSDVDLAVLASTEWDGRTQLEDAVSMRVGTSCDVLVFSPDEFERLARGGEEPVVREIIADGIALVGTIPRLSSAVA